MKALRTIKALSIAFILCVATALICSAQLTTLHSFSGSDGANPAVGLVLATDGNFYGTASIGGVYGWGSGGGTAFKITPSGTLTTLYSFCQQGPPYCGDGDWPLQMIQGRDGNFYGVTQNAGEAHGARLGNIFQLTPSGRETSLFLFCSILDCYDGNSPTSIMQANDGNFYGVDYNGGDGQGGAFWQLVANSWAFNLLFNFDTQTTGIYPTVTLVQGRDGQLYGVTPHGGTGLPDCASYCGTVFKITLSGHETVLYNFCSQTNCTDGAEPAAALVQGSDGNFYGTTSAGGAYSNGTVFRITPSGTMTILHSFAGGEGNNVLAPLIQGSDGNFYGTASGSGAHGYGAIFEITPSGTFTLLYSFNNSDGANPQGGLVEVNGTFYGTTYAGGANNDGTVFKFQVPPTLTVSTFGDGTVASTDGFIICPGTCSHTYPEGTPVTLNATPGQGWVFGGWNGACAGTSSCNVTMTQPLSVDAIFSQALQFVAATPCRVVDTRPQHGGSGSIQGGTFQSFPIQQAGGCNIPTDAAAYSLNVTVVPQGPLGYLTIWPTGEYQPVVSTMNSVDGRVKADAAIVPAGSGGEVSVYVTNTTDVILDIDGYFAPVSSSTLAFYPLPPCRVVDTRVATFPPGLGPPSLSALTPRDLPVLLSPCIPTGINPAAYSFNFTVVPGGHPVGYLSAWPTGQSQPVVSTLNDQTGTIVANAAIVPASTGGDISVYSTNDTQLLIDINGYFAPAGQDGLSLYPVAPCRVIDTRHGGSGQPFSGTLTPPVDVVDSACEPPAAAQAYVFNATVVPTGALGYLTLWPDGTGQPVVSTLNAFDGALTNNMAIVPSTNGKVDAFANGLTQLILDISSYFAP
jgi:uncharacterized repeat protein (TIGR03803 family)